METASGGIVRRGNEAIALHSSGGSCADFFPFGEGKISWRAAGINQVTIKMIDDSRLCDAEITLKKKIV